MVKYASESHKALCQDQSIPPKIWIGLALQLLLRVGQISQTIFDLELSKLKLPPKVQANLLKGMHCMISPLCDRASMLAATQIQLFGAPFNEESLFWALLSQIAVHSKEVLAAMARDRNEAQHADYVFCREEFGASFENCTRNLALKTCMNSKLAQPVLHFLRKCCKGDRKEKRTHISMVLGFIKNFDFKGCAAELEQCADHEERFKTLVTYCGGIHLRIISVLRLLEATACPHWQGAWESGFKGDGALLVMPGMSNAEFHNIVMEGVEELAPTWLLRMLDEFPLRLDTLQTSQHVRCEVRKMTGVRLPKYIGSDSDDYRMQFSTSMRLMGSNPMNFQRLHYRRLHLQSHRSSLEVHKRKYQELLQDGAKEETVFQKYFQAVSLGSDLHQNLVHIGSWLLSVQNLKETPHAGITTLLTYGLLKISENYDRHEEEAKPQHRGRLLCVADLLLERADECNCKRHRRLRDALLSYQDLYDIAE